MNMSKKCSVVFLFTLFLTSVFLCSNAQAAAPQITNVKFKAAGDSPKIVVFFDQPVYSDAAHTQALVQSDFVLGGASGTVATISSVVHSSSTPSNIAVLNINTNVNAMGGGQWTVAASSTQIFSMSGETATTTAVDLNGKGDSVAPAVIGVFQHNTNALDVMFSEEVGSGMSFSGFLTAAGGDAPGISDAQLVPEKTFMILMTTASTTLGWGAGNSIDVGSFYDLVNNYTAATSTFTILPALKISEVKAEAASANTQDEFIELYNFGDLNLNIATSTLFLHFRNGANDTAVPLNLMKSQIPDKSYYLIGNQTGYSGGVSLDAGYSSSTDILTGNSSVYISASSATGTLVIDLLGMGSSAIKETATTTALIAGKSYERKAQSSSATSTMAAGGNEEFKGNSYDSNNNSGDFLLRNTPQPQNSMSPKEFPFGGPGANDTGAPQVMGSFPSGNPGEMVPNNLSYVGFNVNEPVQENTISTSTVKLYANSASAINLCSSVSYTNFPTPGNPPGKCVVSLALAAETHTFKIFGDSTNATSSTAVRDMVGNALSQPSNNKGDVSGNYIISFTPSSGGSNYTFMAPPVFVMGSLPFPGAVNIPTNMQKVYVKFSGDVATSTLNTTNVKLIKVSDSSVVSLSGVSSSASESKFVSDMAVMTLSGALLANTQYQISVMGVMDTQSLPVGVPPMFVFTTGSGADLTGPLVTGKLPSITSGVPVNAIDIHVMTDDKLDPNTIASTTVKVLQGSNEIPGVVDFDPFTGEIMFFANNVFQANTSYTVSVNATTTNPCVKNVSNICLQDNDGTPDGAYKFLFTTGGADATSPSVLFANADQRNMSVSFNEPVNKLESENLDNYSLTVGGATSTLSSMAGQRVFYDTVGRTAVIENLNLPMGSSFTVTASNIHDLSGNLIGAQNSAQGAVQDMSKTMGFVGPGGPMIGGDMPQNFATSTFGFVPSVEVRPMSPMTGATTNYFVGVPLSQQIKSSAGSGKVVLTFPTGFDVSSAVLETQSPMANDVNGPGPGTVAVNSVAVDSGARTITLTLTQNTRCDTGNATPCSGDAHDFLGFDLKNIVNSSIPKDASSGGYTVDVKTMNGATIAESLTSKAFYLMPGGTNILVVNLTAAGATTGTTTIRMFSPLTGPKEAISTAFSGGVATSTFTGLVDGDYGIFTDPLITLGATDYMGRAMPSPVRISGGATTTVALVFNSTSGMATTTVNITAPSGKNIDVFANSGDKFIMKTITTSGSDSVQLKLSDGTWFVGVGPAIPKGAFTGPPPAPDFVMQPPAQVIVSGTSVNENSGTPNDGTLVFTLSSASLALSGTVADASARAIVGAEVFAYSPMGGFGTHGTTDALGKFSLQVGAGMYQVGVFVPGLPPSGEMAVEVKSDGAMVSNGQTVSSVALKLIKPERTISGKVLDQNNNPAQGAGVFAYCDPSVSNNACFGPGDHTGGPTNSDGSYTLYIKNGTWKVGAFLPGFGELPQIQQVVAGSDISSVNFYPNTGTTFNDVSGTVCRGVGATCGGGDTKISGAFVRVFGSAGANQTVTDQGGVYKVKVPAGTGYTIEVFDPALGRLKPLVNIDISTSTTTKDFVVAAPQTVTINVKNSLGNFVVAEQLFIDFFDFTNQTGNHLEIKNSASSTISLPGGTSYKVRASLRGQNLTNSDIASDAGGTTADFATSTAILTINGAEMIKIILPALGTVSGTVYKTSALSGNELSDAFVNITDQVNGIFISAQTNASGTYAVKLPLGSYNAMAQKPGYMANSVLISVATSTATTTLNLITSQATLAISGTVNISGSAASKAFVRAEKMGGGFSSAQTDSSGIFSLAVTNGTWRVYTMAEGYSEAEYSGPIEISGSSATGILFNLTTKVVLQTPKMCQITPAQGGECSDTTNGIKVTVPPGAFGSDTNSGTLTIKQTNARQQTESSKPVGVGFDFEMVDSSGTKISTFNSAVTLEFTQNKSDLVASGINTKTKVDGVKITLWSETIKDYDVLVTTVDYLDASDALVSAPLEDLSNVSKIRLKALTTHFSGGGPSEGGDSLSPASPSAPSVSGGSSSVSVSWSAVTTNQDGTSISDLSDYRVWRSTSSGSGFSVITTIAGASYTDNSVTSGATYYYKVTARDTNSNESAQSSASGSVTPVSSSVGIGIIGSVPPSTPALTPTQNQTVTTSTTTQAVTTITPSSQVVAILIRVDGDPRVYVVVNNFKRHIPSPAVFDSYGYKWADIKMVPAGESAKFQITTLMRVQGDPKVYAIENGARKWITSPEEFNLKGYKWDAIIEVNTTEIAAYQEVSVVAPIAATAGKLTMELQSGMRNDQVKLLQEFLVQDKAIYPESKITGYFGPATKAAVKRFQAKYGISQVGRVGPATMAKLNELMK